MQPDGVDAPDHGHRSAPADDRRPPGLATAERLRPRRRDPLDLHDLHAPYDDETRGLSQRIFRSGTLAAERYRHVPRSNSPHRPDAVVPDVDICGHFPVRLPYGMAFAGRAEPEIRWLSLRATAAARRRDDEEY